MVEESCEMSVRQRCLWFTSMLGKHASVAKIVGLLRDKNVCRLLFFFSLKPVFFNVQLNILSLAF